MNKHIINTLNELADAAFKKGESLPIASFDRHEWQLIALDLTRAMVRLERILAQEKSVHG